VTTAMRCQMLATGKTVLCVILATLALCLSHFGINRATAFMLNADGTVETPAGLYASASGGGLIKIIEPGSLAPGGGIVTELGIPSLSPDGTLVFSAEVTSQGVSNWQIFRVRRPLEKHSIELVISSSMESRECRPILRFDPEVSAGRDGTVAFIGSREDRSNALFVVSGNRLSCPASLGDRTRDGHILINLASGTAQVAENGATIFRANVRGTVRGDLQNSTKEAILVARPGEPLQEVAVEGGRSADGLKYGASFGSPAIFSSPHESVIAFTNHTPRGITLFMGSAEHLISCLNSNPTGTSGEPTYISDGRPAISADGSVAVQAARQTTWSVLVVRAGEAFSIATEGDKLSTGERVDAFGDLARTGGDGIVAEVVGDDDINRVYAFPTVGSNKGSGEGYVLTDHFESFPGGFATSSTGAFAFLSRGKPPDFARIANHFPGDDDSL
jgi:hypothetical protein